MTTHTINQSLTDLIWSLNDTAKIAALRAIANSSLAKAIGSIRQDIRQRNATVRDETVAALDCDILTQELANERATRTSAEEMGFEENEPPILTASKYIAVYDSATVDLKTLTTSKWDEPMTLAGMLQFMVTKSNPLSKALVQTLAKELKCDEREIVEMYSLQEQRERELLEEAIPEIISTFKGHAGNGHEEAIAELNVVQQHQLGVKLVESLTKARATATNRIMRSKRLDELGSLTLLREGIDAVRSWVQSFEDANLEEIRIAVDQGRARTLDDM